MKLTRSVEDYLKAILELEGAGGLAATGDLARRLGISAPSVTGMLRRLSRSRPALVAYTKHRGARLTAAGRRRALEIVRHHRLIERFLFDALGVPWDEVHEEAERLEHAISERLEAHMAERLGYPGWDPHGQPIPDPDGRMIHRPTVRLDLLDAGRAGRIAEVSDHDPALLRHLAELGLMPGSEFRLVERAPFGGPLTLEVGGEWRRLGPEAAACLQVIVTSEAEAAS